MLKTVVLLNIFVEIFFFIFFNDFLIKKEHLFHTQN